MRLLLTLVAVALGLVHSVSANYLVTVDANAQECFHIDLTAGTKFSLTFVVSDGGFLDIDVQITGPDGKPVYSGERETDGSMTFSAHSDGRFAYCFSNKMSTVTPKTVAFDVFVGSKPRSGPETDPETADKEHAQLAAAVHELGNAITAVKREQDYMEVRERNHRIINESTNSRVVWWSFFEALVLIAVTLGQVYYLKQFFEVKRVV